MPRRKLTVEERKARGARPKSDAPAEVAIDADAPLKPERLSQEASDYWDQLVPNLVKRGLVCFLDSEVLADYCEVVTTKNVYQEILNESGKHTKKHPNNTESESLESKMFEKYCKEATRLGELLGLSPKARKQMGIVLAKKKEQPTKAGKEKASILRPR